jgi:hypothetical protein
VDALEVERRRHADGLEVHGAIALADLAEGMVVVGARDEVVGATGLGRDRSRRIRLLLAGRLEARHDDVASQGQVVGGLLLVTEQEEPRGRRRRGAGAGVPGQREYRDGVAVLHLGGRLDAVSRRLQATPGTSVAADALERVIRGPNEGFA